MNRHGLLLRLEDEKEKGRLRDLLETGGAIVFGRQRDYVFMPDGRTFVVNDDGKLEEAKLPYSWLEDMAGEIIRGLGGGDEDVERVLRGASYEDIVRLVRGWNLTLVNLGRENDLLDVVDELFKKAEAGHDQD
ncbi:MAG: hypothetical protein N2557_08010 [Hydrogenophilus sp.]|nr:hypothetical protein [Hydrogenophilus sp.]